MSTTPTLHAFHAAAHDLRNQLNVITTGSQLVDEPDVAAELRAAAAHMTRDLEQLLTSARIELGVVPDTGTISIGELIERAGRRARREGAAATVRATSAEFAELVVGPVPIGWVERVLADIVHAAPEAVTIDIAASPGQISVHCHGVGPRSEFVADLAQRIAHVAGFTVSADAVLALPRPVDVR